MGGHIVCGESFYFVYGCDVRVLVPLGGLGGGAVVLSVVLSFSFLFFSPAHFLFFL